NAMPFAMGNQLGRLGYATYAFHNHTYDYYRRDVSHPTWDTTTGAWATGWTSPHLAGVGRGDDRADRTGGPGGGAVPRLLHDRQRAPAVHLRRQRHGRQEPRARRGPALLRGGAGLPGEPDRAGSRAGAVAEGAGGGRRRRPDAP